jgi:meiotically up-regulated gene 157 (Mug157) protein
MFLLQWSFWQSSPERAAAFLTENDEIKQAVFALVDLLKTEQQHSASSPYYYKPLPNAFADQTGMVWSFARPSDDQTELGYNVPQNLMAVSVLSKLGAMNDALWLDADLALGLSTLKQEIEVGIKTYGILIPASAPDDDDDDSVVVFAFETDGWGNTTSPVLDDANMPNLLWLPYLGFDEEAFPPGIYENTRKLILSASNLNWFENPAAAEVSILTTGDVAAVVGLGSQHQSLGLRPQWPGQECTEQCVWHLGLVMQGMTAADHATEEGGDKGGGNDDDDGGGDSEKAKCLQLVLDTAFHGLMHEGFNVANTSNYNRDYFGWANALFSEWVLSDFVSSEARPPS